MALVAPELQSEMFRQSSKAEPLRLDLPDAEVLLFEGFFDPPETHQLFKALETGVNWQQDHLVIHGKKIPLPRLTAWYGDYRKSYSYSGITMHAQPWSSDLLQIKNRIEAEAGTRFNSALLNFYRGGRDSVQWHSDDEVELGRNPVIASVSFGASRMFQMKHRRRKELPRVDIPLHDGSFLLMQGPTQHFWRHQVPKTSKPVGPRINITFRVIC